MTAHILAAGLAGPVRPGLHLPPGLVAALAPVLVVLLGLDAFCLINLARSKSVRNAPKLAWIIVILCVSAPLGALLYLFFGMPRNPGGRGPELAAVGVTAAAGQSPAKSTAVLTPVRSAGHPGAELMVATSGLTRDYGGIGLFDVDLAVPRGSIYGLVGLNGAGKTTLLSLLSGIKRADSGTVRLGTDRSQIAVCPDVPEFDSWLTAYEAVDLARSLVAPAMDAAAVRVALHTAGLGDVPDRRVSGFSRGMIQRLGLACALVGDPQLLILDEPTSALDPAGRAEMLDLVAAMRGRRTVLFSSHILADVQRVADQVGILRDGRLLYQGATQELIDTCLSPSWLLRIAGGTEAVAAAMAAEHWATKIEQAGSDLLRIDAVSVEAGERGIPAVIAACRARQVSCEPAAADLESAFLTLTGAS